MPGSRSHPQHHTPAEQTLPRTSRLCVGWSLLFMEAACGRSMGNLDSSDFFVRLRALGTMPGAFSVDYCCNHTFRMSVLSCPVSLWHAEERVLVSLHGEDRYQVIWHEIWHESICVFNPTSKGLSGSDLHTHIYSIHHMIYVYTKYAHIYVCTISSHVIICI